MLEYIEGPLKDHCMKCSVLYSLMILLVFNSRGSQRKCTTAAGGPVDVHLSPYCLPYIFSWVSLNYLFSSPFGRTPGLCINSGGGCGSGNSVLLTHAVLSRYFFRYLGRALRGI